VGDVGPVGVIEGGVQVIDWLGTAAAFESEVFAIDG